MSPTAKNASSGGDDSRTADSSPQSTAKRTADDNPADERTRSAADLPDDRTDDDGNLIDPPVIPSFEQRLAVAHAEGDDAEIADVSAEYHEARMERARRLAQREQERRERERQEANA